MKRTNIFLILCGLLLATVSTSCISRMKTTGMSNGWYNIKNPEQNLVGSKPIVRASDFTNLHLDSAKIQGSGQTIYTITGNVVDREQWEKATQKAVGSHIGFIYYNRLVCAPRINSAVDNGRFMISFPVATPLEAAENVYANLISQQKDNPLGAWQRLYYKGTLPAASCPGTVYELTVKKFQHSGDGTFQLRLTYLEAENGKDTHVYYQGKLYTLRGSADNINDTVWQFIADDAANTTFNFLYTNDGNTLTLLNAKLERADTQLNYSLQLSARK